MTELLRKSLAEKARAAAASNPPFGFKGLDAATQEALGVFFIGLWFARAGACGLARRLKGRLGDSGDEDGINIHELRRAARATPYLIDMLRTVENDVSGRGTINVRELYRQLRAYVRNAVQPADEAVTVQAEARHAS